MQIYCFKCKCKRAVNNVTVAQTKNGRHQARGQCGVCGNNVFVFVKNPNPSPEPAAAAEVAA